MEKGNKNKAEDILLIKDALNNDNKSFDKLMEKYYNSIFKTVILKVKTVDDAEDITIESFAKAFLNLNKYSQEFSFSTWINTIARNTAIDFLRKNNTNNTSIEVVDFSNSENAKILISLSQNAEDYTINKQKMIILSEIIKKLKPNYQVLIKLRYFENYTYKEIAEELDIPQGSVKARLFRAKEFLLKIINDNKLEI